MSRPILSWASLLGVLLGVGLWGRAGEPPRDAAQAIRDGLAHYEKGRSAEAIQSLQAAIDLIQQGQQAGVETYLPKTMPGWQAGDIEREQFAAGTGEAQAAFFKVSRTFTRGADDATLTVSLLNSPQYIQPQREMLTALKGNPLMLQAMNQQGNRKTAFVERDGWAGWQTVDNDAPESEVMLLAEGWMLEVRASIADAALLTKVLSSIDLKGIAKPAH